MSATISFVRNARVVSSAVPADPVFGVAQAKKVRRFHATVPGYAPTELVKLPALAKVMGVKAVYVKDEGSRFGLKAFKALGATWAMANFLCAELGLDADTVDFADFRRPELAARIGKMVFATTTDGNHGKGVAWTAAQLGCPARIFMPRGTVPARVEAIVAASGGRATVEVTDFDYDGTVQMTAALAKEHGWTLVQDTSWPGYEKIPTWIAQGYLTMADEMAADLRAAGTDAPTHVFLQAGVGSMAGAVTGYLADAYTGARPAIAIVESTAAACCLESAAADDGAVHTATGSGETIMAGLNCGSVCTVVWPTLRDHAAYFLAGENYLAAEAMRRLARPATGDKAITAGESGAAGVGAALLVAIRPELAEIRTAMNITANSVLLFINTEADTDPDGYRAVMAGAHPWPE